MQASPAGFEGPAESVLASLMDPETTLPRVWLFLARLTEEVQRAERYGRLLALCVLEPEDPMARLDGEFRGKVGRAVRGHLRGSDFATVGHSGRLLVLLPETVEPAAERAARRLVATLNSLMAEGKPLPWRAALVWYPRHGKNPQQLLDSAERVLAQQPAA
jgi:GGDEF domain-containing protein